MALTEAAKARKGKNFSPDEERQLCRSCLHISQDPIIGNGQHSTAFWERILKHYNNHLPTGCEPRPSRSLETKWGIIKPDVANFFWKTNLFVHAIPTSSWGWRRRDLGGGALRGLLSNLSSPIFWLQQLPILCALQESELQGRKKKNLFVRPIPTSWWGWRLRDLGGGRSLRPPLELVVAGFLIAAATDSCALAVSVHINSLCAH
jgi:hypothetical protein